MEHFKEEFRPNPHGAASNHPKSIIIHCMGEYIRTDDGRELYAPDFLEEIGLSAHALITPDGTVTRTRDDEQGAYHAKGHNADSLGYECLVPGVHDLASLQARVKKAWLSGKQWSAVVRITREAMRRWDIKAGAVERHMDLDPDRRWFDPGPCFPWSLFQSELHR